MSNGQTSHQDWLQLFQQCATPEPVSTPCLPTIAIANPPYADLKTDYQDNINHYLFAHRWHCRDNNLIERTDRVQKKVRAEVLFIERCVRSVQPGEVLCFLLPNGILSNSEHQALRRWLATEMVEIIASIQLPPELWQIECSTGLVTSILLLQRKTDSEPEDYDIFMAVCETCGFDSRGRTIYRKDDQGNSTEALDDDLPVIIQRLVQFLQPKCQPESQPIQPLTAAQILAEAGLTVTESMTTPKKSGKQPRSVWLVTGRVEPFRQMLYDLGGKTRFTGRNTFSFWNDPTDDIAEAIGIYGESSLEDQVAHRDTRSLERSERLDERAANHQNASDAAYQRSNAAVEGIPLGQPILVGHHSERHHRRALEQSNSAMRTSVDESAYAQHLAGKAESSRHQVEKRQSIEYMGNRLKEAHSQARVAQALLAEDPNYHKAQLNLQDAEAAIAHWQKEIESVGGMLSQATVQDGDWVKFCGSWHEVSRVNRKSVTVKNWLGCPELTYCVAYHKLEGHRSSTSSNH